MAGIYIHIPFCKQACHYCNFHFSTLARQTDTMINAICREAELRAGYINESVHTVYFGGGTPSLAEANQIGKIIMKIGELFSIETNAEITLEANPDDITEEKLHAWKTIGINRLSIGIQSFFDEDLQWMNRVHSAAHTLKSITLAQKAGFDNITVDFIYGTPTLTDDRWKYNVDTALKLNIPHLSCYALTVEPKTALEKMIREHKIQNVDADKQSHQFELLMQWMEKAGYEHYEISNFSKPGYRSRHNSNYWHSSFYIGLGPSAHSFNGNSRQWNISNNALYIKNIEQDIIPFEKEELSDIQRLNEYIMTSIRTMEGLSLQTVKMKWNDYAAQKIVSQSQKFIENKMMVNKDCHLILTSQGKLFADGIAANLFS